MLFYFFRVFTDIESTSCKETTSNHVDTQSSFVFKNGSALRVSLTLNRFMTFEHQYTTVVIIFH